MASSELQPATPDPIDRTIQRHENVLLCGEAIHRSRPRRAGYRCASTEDAKVCAARVATRRGRPFDWSWALAMNREKPTPMDRGGYQGITRILVAGLPPRAEGVLF